MRGITEQTVAKFDGQTGTLFQTLQAMEVRLSGIAERLQKLDQELQKVGQNVGRADEIQTGQKGW